MSLAPKKANPGPHHLLFPPEGALHGGRPLRSPFLPPPHLESKKLRPKTLSKLHIWEQTQHAGAKLCRADN